MRSQALLLLLAVVHFQGACYGWWDTGHMLVAEISWKYLLANTTANQVTMDALQNAISALPTYSNRTDDYITSACWMDDIKSRGLAQFSNWHFINIPVCGYPDPAECTNISDYISVNEALESGSENVVWAIEQAQYTITSKTAMGFERAFALRNLLHLIGDIHQPLHAVDRYAPETPFGDAGGNGFKINASFANNNLHGFWDSVGGMYSATLIRPLNTTNQAYISAQADWIMNQTDPTTYIGGLNVTEWALESLALATDVVYTNISFYGIPSAYYTERTQQVAIQQIGKAGYRLAMMLKTIIGCNGNTTNCPMATTPTNPHQVRDYKAAVIGLSVVCGVMAVIVIVLAYRLHKRAPYRTIE